MDSRVPPGDRAARMILALLEGAKFTPEQIAAIKARAAQLADVPPAPKNRDGDSA